MALETRASPLEPELTLPPPFTLVRLRELGDAFAHAISVAPKQGAGTLVYWRLLFDSADECARIRSVVVEANEQNLDRLEAHLTTLP
jgi:hypothetical protein